MSTKAAMTSERVKIEERAHSPWSGSVSDAKMASLSSVWCGER
jgi:hypothetical protein